MNVSELEIHKLMKAVHLAHHTAKYELLVCGLAGLVAPIHDEAIGVEGEEFLWSALKEKAARDERGDK